VIAWGVLFAVPTFVWATGHTYGASSTVSPDLVKMVRDGVTWFMVVLWTTAFLKLFGAALGALMTRPRSTRIGRFAMFCAGGASTLLAGHGLLFIVTGTLAQTHVISLKTDLTGITRWYLYLWGPYFVLGGVAFGLSTLWYLRHAPDRARIVRYAQVGVTGGLLLTLFSVLSGIG